MDFFRSLSQKQRYLIIYFFVFSTGIVVCATAIFFIYPQSVLCKQKLFSNFTFEKGTHIQINTQNHYNEAENDILSDRKYDTASSSTTTLKIDSSDMKDDKTDIVKEEPPKVQALTEISAWIYPGNPSCAAMQEVQDGRKIDTLKLEFFTINDGGVFKKMTEEEYGCNGYSATTTKKSNALSKKQYITISSSYARDMDVFLMEALRNPQYMDDIVSTTIESNFEGVELDFEDFGGWTDNSYKLFLRFVDELANRLHTNKKELLVDVPPVQNEIEEQWYKLRLQDLFAHKVDQIVVMAYDYQFDKGIGSSIAPPEWISSVVAFMKTKVPNEYITIGIPSYAYQANRDTGKIQILTYQQISQKSGFTKAKRMKSGELSWSQGSMVYVFQDTFSMRKKVEAVQAQGIGKISVWHLGGNPWFF